MCTKLEELSRILGMLQQVNGRRSLNTVRCTDQSLYNMFFRIELRERECLICEEVSTGLVCLHANGSVNLAPVKYNWYFHPECLLIKTSSKGITAKQELIKLALESMVETISEKDKVHIELKDGRAQVKQLREELNRSSQVLQT